MRLAQIGYAGLSTRGADDYNVNALLLLIRPRMMLRHEHRAVDVFYKSAQVAKVFQSASLLRKAYGAENAGMIQRRLFVLESVRCLGDVPRLKPERCHPLDGKLAGCFAVDVLHPFRIAFSPADATGVATQLGGRAWEKASAITILDLLDHH